MISNKKGQTVSILIFVFMVLAVCILAVILLINASKENITQFNSLESMYQQKMGDKKCEFYLRVLTEENIYLSYQESLKDLSETFDYSGKTLPSFNLSISDEDFQSVFVEKLLNNLEEHPSTLVEKSIQQSCESFLPQTVVFEGDDFTVLAGKYSFKTSLEKQGLANPYSLEQGIISCAEKDSGSNLACLQKSAYGFTVEKLSEEEIQIYYFKSKKGYYSSIEDRKSDKLHYVEFYYLA